MTPTSKAHTPDFVSPVSSHGPALSAPSVRASVAKRRVMEHCGGSNDDARQYRKVAVAGAPIYECHHCGKLVRWQSGGMFPEGKLRAHGRLLSAVQS